MIMQPIPVSPGTKRAFGSLLLTVLLLAILFAAGVALFGLYGLVAWLLADLSEAAAGAVVALSVVFCTIWWGVWHTMRQDGLFEDDND